MRTVTKSDSPGRKIAGTVVGNAWTQLYTVADGEDFQSIVVNHDIALASGSTVLYLTAVKRDASGPTHAVDESIWRVSPGGDRSLALGPGWKLYGRNDTGAATTTKFVVQLCQ